MKKKLALLLLLALLACACAARAEEKRWIRSIVDPTWVRGGPGLDYGILDSLQPGGNCRWGGRERVDARGVAWYNVVYAGGRGWVSSLQACLVSTEGTTQPEPEAGHGVTVTPTASVRTSVNVRSGPGESHDVIGKLTPGEHAPFTGNQEDGWLQVLWYGQSGWVSEKWTRVD